ncbi:MAG: metallophosphoesterase [Spirochaetia bacterium]|nr:metallophosphoesterase [Spirochaetia bacterium]
MNETSQFTGSDPTFSGSKAPKLKYFISILFLLLLLLPAFMLVEPYTIIVKEYTIVSRDVPSSFDGTVAAFVADIHHGPFFGIDRVKGLVRRLNTIEPDMVLMGGDYVHRDSKYIAPFFEEMKNIKPKLGVFAVLGNHDHWEDAGLCYKKMEDAGITRLDNAAVWVKKGNDRIRIGGVGDLTTDIQDLRPVLDGAKNSDFVILLSHNPDYAEKITTDKIDLILSGHTHGGQLTFFGQWAPLNSTMHGEKYRTGMKTYANFSIIISNGVGTITPPFRLFASPDIVKVVFKKAY